MGKYCCKTCGSKFSQKSHYDAHLNKKIPCELKDKSLNEIIEEKVKKEVEKEVKKIKKVKDEDLNENSDEDIEVKKVKKVSDLTSDEETEINEIKKNKEIKIKKTKSIKTNSFDDSYLRNPDNVVIFKYNDSNNKEEEKKYVLSKIKQAHQILYNAENIEGENAMNDIMNLIFLKLIENKISSKEKKGFIDLKNKEHYNDVYDDDSLKDIFPYFTVDNMAIAELSLLRSKKHTDIIKQLGGLLKLHPITKNIFIEENFLRTEKSSTLQLLINTMFINEKTKWSIEKMYEIEDLIGEIYESFINGYTKTNSKLSQFFTPRNLMGLILNFLKNDIKKHIKNNENYSVADFCMGTAGWLVIFYNMFKDKYADKILLSGGEVKPNTFQYGLMNLITTLNGMPYYVQRDNSLTHINKDKHHLLLMNPPFKTDFKFEQVVINFKNDEYTRKNKIKIDDVYKLKDNNPPIQFLELCIYKLHEGGKCIIVLPYGELFFSSSYKKAREYFLDNIDITHIIICPSGIFTHTGIKTCIMIFNKDSNGTKNITFLKTNKECSELIKITDIKKEDIMKEPNLSFYYPDYINDEYIIELTNKINKVDWVNFGDVFTLEKGKLQSSKVEEDENGDVLFITKSEISEFTLNIKSDIFYDSGLFIANAFNGNGKCPIRYTDKKCIQSDLMLYCQIHSNYKNKINLKFIYYYLLSIKEHIEKNYEKGSCNLSLDQKNFNRLKIPIPSLEHQEKIVNYITSLEQRGECLKNLLDKNNNTICMYLEIKLKNEIYKNTKIKTLEELVDTMETGKSLNSDENHNGNIPSYGSNGITTYVNEFLFNGEYVLLGRKGTCGVSHYVNCKFYACDTVFVIKTNNLMKPKFLYYLLTLYKLNNVSKLEGKGSVVGGINKSNLFKLKIPCPNIKIQEEILIDLQTIEKEYKLLNKLYNDNLNLVSNNFFELLK